MQSELKVEVNGGSWIGKVGYYNENVVKSKKVREIIVERALDIKNIPM